MADLVVLSPPRRASMPVRVAVVLPGVLLLAAVGYTGKFLEECLANYSREHHLLLPNIEYVLWAILLGLAISNTVGVPRIFRRAWPATSFG